MRNYNRFTALCPGQCFSALMLLVGQQEGHPAALVINMAVGCCCFFLGPKLPSQFRKPWLVLINAAY